MPTWCGGVPAGLAAGVLGAHLLFFFGLPASIPAGLILGVAALLRAAFPAALAIGLALAEESLESRRADRLDPRMSDTRVQVRGYVEGLPDVYATHTRFRFRPEAGSGLPGLLIAYWYRDAPPLVPGDSWQLDLLVKPPWGEVNFRGADRERWYFAEGVGALATVRSGLRLDAVPRGPPWHRWRHAIRERVMAAEPQSDTGKRNADRPNPGPRGLLLALTIADRSGVSVADQRTLTATGTAHLLAISGLHVGLAALYGFWMARVLLLALPGRYCGVAAWPVSAMAGGLAALVYAALAGFGTSTLRALLMLAIALLAVLARRSIHAGRAWLVALAAVLVADPLAPLRAPFWLSFVAVAVLLMQFAPRRDRGFWYRLALAQAGIMLVMLPLNAWWFQLASPAGLIANLVAIPWVSFTTVPIALLGLALLPVQNAWAGWLFALAGLTADWLTRGLEWLARLPGALVELPQPSLWATVLASLAALLLLLPRGVPQRRLALVWMLPLLLATRPVPPGAVRIEALDTGQGTAALLATEDRLLLYDSGPGDGKAHDRVGAVIAPAIRQLGLRRPERIVISHADLDHAGGLPALQARYPDTPVYASLPQPPPGVEACQDELAWNWDGTEFRVLHPSRYLPYLGNDASCVVSARRGALSVLLPGDISQAVEQRLAVRGLAPHTVLLVPHHGSASSSTIGLLDATKPRVAIATTGPGNRFGFPRAEVRDRYRAAGIPLWATGDCGALRVELGAGGEISAVSARRARPAPWRWPPAPECP